MGKSVWYLIASLLLVLVNGEINNSEPQASNEGPETSTPASSHQLAGIKELVLYLTPDQAKILEDAGAIVRPFPEFENAFLQQKLQQSVEESQNQPTSDNEDKGHIQNPDEFYKIFNIQQLNDNLTTYTQTELEATEKSRAKFKYIPKGSQQDYAASYVQKKNNKVKNYSTEYVRYLPNFEVENFKMKPYEAEPLPGYYSQNTQSNEESQTYLHTGVDEIQKPEQVQANEKDKNIQRPYNRQRLEYFQKQKRPIEAQKLKEIQSQGETYRSQGIQRPHNIQGLEYIQNQKSPVEILRNIQRFKYVQKSKRPLETQKLAEVQKNEDIQIAGEIQRQYSPQEIQKIEVVQRYEDFKRPVEIHRPYRPVEHQRHEEIQRPENTQSFISGIQRVQQTSESLVQNESSSHDKGPVTFKGTPQILESNLESAKVEKSNDIQTPSEIQTPLVDLQTGTLIEEQAKSLASPLPSVSVSTSTAHDQYSSLLAPLIQHDKITESIAQKAELENSEHAIQMRLQQLKQSGSTDSTIFQIEIDKLNNNLGRQNALAQQLALEVVSNKNKPQISIKENLSSKQSPSLELKHPIKGPQPHPVPLGNVRPIPVPVLQPETVDLENPVPTEGKKLIPTPEIYLDYPYILQTRRDLPDNISVIRPIWEH